MQLHKTAIIVHRWSGAPEADWYPWLARELERRGYDVIIPPMPNPDEPDIAAWTTTLGKLLAEHQGDQLLFVGHSIGCQTIVRTLETIDVHIDRAIFVAGWLRLNELNEEEKATAEPWLTKSIDAATARGKIDKSVAIFSADDPLVPLSNQDFFRDQLGSEIVILNGYGHFDAETAVTQIPEILTYIP